MKIKAFISFELLWCMSLMLFFILLAEEFWDEARRVQSTARNWQKELIEAHSHASRKIYECSPKGQKYFRELPFYFQFSALDSATSKPSLGARCPNF